MLTGLRRLKNEIEDDELLSNVKDVCQNEDTIRRFVGWLNAYRAH